MDYFDIPDNYYLKHSEPIQGCLFALKRLILGADKRISETRKYQVPFFYYKEKKLCFLWVNRKKLMLGFVTDKSIFPVVGGSKRKDEMEMIQIDPNSDLPVEMILKRIEVLIILYESA
jgi:hypothetical protein